MERYYAMTTGCTGVGCRRSVTSGQGAAGEPERGVALGVSGPVEAISASDYGLYESGMGVAWFAGVVVFA